MLCALAATHKRITRTQSRSGSTLSKASSATSASDLDDSVRLVLVSSDVKSCECRAHTRGTHDSQHRCSHCTPALTHSPAPPCTFPSLHVACHSPAHPCTLPSLRVARATTFFLACPRASVAHFCARMYARATMHRNNLHQHAPPATYVGCNRYGSHGRLQATH